MEYTNASINYAVAYRAPNTNNYCGNASASMSTSYAKTPFYIPAIKYNNSFCKAYSG